MGESEHKKQCFVIMPFSEQRTEVFEFGIAPACESAGFEAVRVDKLVGHFNINRKIVEHIFNCEAVIAEITDKNPNVFYEMGVAHAIGNKTIMIAQSAQDLPFDIRNYRCIIYQQSVKGLQQLQKEIAASLRELEKWNRYPSNPVQDFKPGEAFVSKQTWEKLSQELLEKDQRLRDSVAKAQWEKLQGEYQKLQNELAAKQRLMKNTVAKADLEAAQQELAKKNDAIARLQQELEQLRSQAAKPQPRSTAKSAPSLALRSQPNPALSEAEVKQILEAKDFFASDWNKNGKGVGHQYEASEQKAGKIVHDHATGLTWQQSGSDGISYANAEYHVRVLNAKRFAGYSDWRLPTLEEAMSLMEPKKHDDLYLDSLFDQRQGWIWTADKSSASTAWVVYFLGYCHLDRVALDPNYVRAVRSGQSNI